MLISGFNWVATCGQGKLVVLQSGTVDYCGLLFMAIIHGVESKFQHPCIPNRRQIDYNQRWNDDHRIRLTTKPKRANGFLT